MSSEYPVVVPLDGSKIAEEAVPYAGRVAKAFGAQVRFVHAADDDALKDEGGLASAQEKFSTYVAGLASQHLPEGVTYEAAIIKGAAAKAILDDAESARVIVISTHGHGGLKATFVGSVTDKVVRSANVPVLVVPGTGTEVIMPGGPVLCAVDGSPEAEQGLVIARELVKLLGAELAILRAYQIPLPVGTEFVYYPADEATVIEQAAKDYVAGLTGAGEKSYVLQGSAAEAIEETANELNAQVVVVTSHGKGFAARLALGSTTDRLMHSMKRPLMVIPVKD